MFTPEYLATFPDYIVELFEQYDAFVIEDFSRRVAKAASVTETAEWQAIRAQEMGLAMDELTKRSSELLNITQEELVSMYQEAYDTYVESDRKRFANSGLDYERIASSKTLQDYMDAAQKQTIRSLRNIIGSPGAIKSITGTTATRLKIGGTYYPVKQAYTLSLDLAQMQVSSGVLDYNTAVRHAIRGISQHGLSTLVNDAVGYESGYHLSVRSAARMCVLTGVNQMAGQMNDRIADELGLDLVEVTAHLGARPSHQVWQGGIYSRSGQSLKYESLVDATGYGTVGGLMGANCRHNMYAYAEGSPRAYTKQELYAMTDEGGPKISYGGKEYTYYEATQRQRQMERQIIATKREIIGYNAAGDQEAFQSASVKLRRQKAKYQDFSNAAGIRSKFERTQQDGYDRSIAGKSSWAVRKEVEKYNKIRYHKDGTIVVTDDWKGKSKPSIPRTYQPNAVVETKTVYRNGKTQIDRTIYDPQGVMQVQIHSGPHNRQDQHPYGKHGEHGHTYVWNEDGTLDSRSKRELTDRERREHADIIGGEADG